jgi:transcriptional regulator with XRE-family HTH domain
VSLLARIDGLRKQRGNISINRLEKECGLTRGSMAKWDKHAPSPDKVKKVADYFHVSVEYLLYGQKGEETKKDPGQKTEAEIDGELLEIWSTGDEDERRALLEMARLIKSRRNKK